MNGRRKIIKCTLVIGLGIGIFTGAFLTYMKWPTGMDYELAKTPISRLTELNSVMSKQQGTNINSYTSSTYKPGDRLYEALLSIQKNDRAKAVEILIPLAEQGDPDAMFWLGDITYSSDLFSSGGEWFVKAAQLGHPYAAMKLSPDFNVSYDCERWLSSYCDHKWGDIGLRILRDRAESGDVKAEYAELFYTRFSNRDSDYFQDFIQVVKKGIDNNYYRPLRNLVYMYQTRKSLNPFDNEVIPLNTNEKELFAKFLFFAAKNNDLPSINLINEKYLEFLPKREGFELIVKQNLPRVDNNYAFIAFDYFIRKYREAPNDRSSLEKGYAYARLFDSYVGDIGPYGRYRGMYKSKIRKINISSLTSEEVEHSNKVFDDILNSSNPFIFIDEVQGSRPLITGDF